MLSSFLFASQKRSGKYIYTWCGDFDSNHRSCISFFFVGIWNCCTSNHRSQGLWARVPCASKHRRTTHHLPSKSLVRHITNNKTLHQLMSPTPQDVHVLSEPQVGWCSRHRMVDQSPHLRYGLHSQRRVSGTRIHPQLLVLCSTLLGLHLRHPQELRQTIPHPSLAIKQNQATRERLSIWRKCSPIEKVCTTSLLCFALTHPFEPSR